jgi:hypothetical protein
MKNRREVGNGTVAIDTPFQDAGRESSVRIDFQTNFVSGDGGEGGDIEGISGDAKPSGREYGNKGRTIPVRYAVPSGSANSGPINPPIDFHPIGGDG